jgi:hypothetical protein
MTTATKSPTKTRTARLTEGGKALVIRQNDGKRETVDAYFLKVIAGGNCPRQTGRSTGSTPSARLRPALVHAADSTCGGAASIRPPSWHWPPPAKSNSNGDTR